MMKGTYRTPALGLVDVLRRAQGDGLGLIGLGPMESSYRLIATDSRWCLRDYGGPSSAPCVLIVAAPIKRPYIWDLAPTASTIRCCLCRHVHVYLLEWNPPSPSYPEAGLEEYADRAIAAAIAAVSRVRRGERPFLLGHSLGGTLAAIHAALDPERIQGLVLVGTPLCFGPRTSLFRDRIVSIAPASISAWGIVPGSVISQLSACALPETFIWARASAAVSNLADFKALWLQARIERWAMDEVALPGALVHQVLEWLFRQDRFYRESLAVRRRTLGPSSMRSPTLVAVNMADEIAPPPTIQPFIERLAPGQAHCVQYAGEASIGLQHLGLLVGRRAHAHVWPKIVAWLNAHC